MIWIILILALCALCIYFNKDLTNPASILLLVWSCVMVVYYINIGKLNVISGWTYALITFGLIAFITGVIFQKYLSTYLMSISYSNTSYNLSSNIVINYRFVLFLTITTIIVLIPEAISSVRILRTGGSFETIRTNFSSGYSTINNSIFSLYRNYFVKPFLYIIYPLSAIDFNFGQKKKWLIVGAIIICVLNTFYEGGRMQFIYLLVHFLLIMRLGGKKFQIRISRKVKIVLFGIILLTVTCLIYITNSRGSSSTFSQTAILYISGCVPLLDHYLKSFDFHPDYTWGLVSISGFLKPVFALLENMGFPYPTFFDSIQYVFEVEGSVSIGAFRMNAFVTLFYYFFYDGGYIGTFIGMFFYGVISEKIYMNTKTYIGMLYYAIIVQGLLFSMIRLQFTISHYCLAFILAILIFKNQRSYVVDEYSSDFTV